MWISYTKENSIWGKLNANSLSGEEVEAPLLEFFKMGGNGEF